MTAARPRLPRLAPTILAAALAIVGTASRASTEPLDDDALRSVTGEGVGIAAHLELNSSVLSGANVDSRITLGFDNNGTKTYAVLQNLAGIADFYMITLSMRQRTAGDPGSDYFDITLPSFVGFKEFGVRALAVLPDPNAAITKDNSYGSLLINGTMTMQGHFYLWPK